MKLSEAMREKMLLSFELFPPKTEKGMANLPGTIEHLMKYRPEYISCTYGAGGGNVGANREVCQMIRNAGTVPVTHFTVIKNTKEGIRQQWNSIWQMALTICWHFAEIFHLVRQQPAETSIMRQTLLNLSVMNLAISSRSQ